MPMKSSKFGSSAFCFLLINYRRFGIIFVVFVLVLLCSAKWDSSLFLLVCLLRFFYCICIAYLFVCSFISIVRLCFVVEYFFYSLVLFLYKNNFYI